MIDTTIRILEQIFLSYAAAFAVISSVVSYIGLRAVVSHSRRLSRTALKDLLANDYYEAISILVPAYNEERTIVAAVRSMLNLQHPLFDVIVCNDGSTDHTVDELIEHFALLEVPIAHDESIHTEPLVRMFRSTQHANLTVIDKQHGGRADALNAALNLARRPLVCVAGADSILDAQALTRASRHFMEEEQVVAVAGTVRPVNGVLGADGQLTELRAPQRWVEKVQVPRYARTFFADQAGWGSLGALTSAFGFGVFRRKAVREVGGWWTGTAADDVDMLVKLHRHYREKNVAYKIAFTPDPICWTQAPTTMAGLTRQHRRWALGATEVFARHRRMFLNPRYGRIGLVALPYRVVFDTLRPVVEAAAYVTIAVTAVLGKVNVPFVVSYLTITLGAGLLQSQLALESETLTVEPYRRLRDRAGLLVASVVEQFPFRQVFAFTDAHATLRLPGWHVRRAKVRREAHHPAHDDRIRAAS